jgi:hypothetical protein
MPFLQALATLECPGGRHWSRIVLVFHSGITAHFLGSAALLVKVEYQMNNCLPSHKRYRRIQIARSLALIIQYNQIVTHLAFKPETQLDAHELKSR